MVRKCSCASRSSMIRFDCETFRVQYAGKTVRVEKLSGWRCSLCGEVEFDADSARRYAEAGDRLVLQERRRQSEEIKRIRIKLGLTQSDAADLTGGGHNAFSRYERGEVTPMPAVINLLKLLDKHPHLLNDLSDRRERTKDTAKVRQKPISSRHTARPEKRRMAS